MKNKLFHIPRNVDFKSLTGRRKARYIWDYYKLPIVIGLIILYIILYAAFHIITHRDMILYTAAVNITNSEKLETYLKDDYLAATGYNPRKQDMTLYSGLYLTTDKDSEYYGYSYASEMKIIGALEAKQLDVVLMDRESFDAFSSNGYLADMDTFLKKHDKDFYNKHKKDLVENTVILSDNADEVSRDSSIKYKARTKKSLLGLSMTDSRFCHDFGFKGDIYLGVIKNTGHQRQSCDYIEYLYY